MKNNNSAIGIFDSGLGGLTVVKEIIKVLPWENIIYFGDTARVPYGTKSKKTVEKFSVQDVHFLTRFNVKLIIAACNTSSSLALSLLKRTFKVPIIGVIEPGVKEAVSQSGTGRIGVIGTRATISSNVYQEALRKRRKDAIVFGVSCPLFVPLIEEGWFSKDITKMAAVTYLTPLIKEKIDVLILGCTHYPLMEAVIGEIMGPGVKLINSARAVAVEVKDLLQVYNLKRTNKIRPKYKFFVSDEVNLFKEQSCKFLGGKIINVKRVNDV